MLVLVLEGAALVYDELSAALEQVEQAAVSIRIVGKVASVQRVPVARKIEVARLAQL